MTLVTIIRFFVALKWYINLKKCMKLGSKFLKM